VKRTLCAFFAAFVLASALVQQADGQVAPGSELHHRAIGAADSSARFLRDFASTGQSHAFVDAIYFASVAVILFSLAEPTSDASTTDIRDAVRRISADLSTDILNGLRQTGELPGREAAGLATYAEILLSLTSEALPDGFLNLEPHNKR